ncbi:MAG: hypothetical protein HY372_02300 [Candidatus Andersenbacteria bacterium]|nr:hypothetical protein [Candidatus Andersenbacteria bacterium]
MKRFLLRHLGNMGDLVFFIPPVLAGLKKNYPGCHITFVTAWGFKDRRGRWGALNSHGYSIHLLITNPHIDSLIHWHDTKTSLAARICRQDGRRFPTWSARYYQQQKNSGNFDAAFELDFGLSVNDNPVQRMLETVGLPIDTEPTYRLYFTDEDVAIAKAVIDGAPRPRIVLLEGLAGRSTRGWDPGKIPVLIKAITARYGAPPLWFGGQYIPDYRGRPLTLRQNIAILQHCDVGVGVLSGPLHFAAAAGLPTITLYGAQPIHRAAPAYFLNDALTDPRSRHRTLLGPTGPTLHFLKSSAPDENLTPAELRQQKFTVWTSPGKQSTKSCVAAITVDEIMLILQDMLP